MEFQTQMLRSCIIKKKQVSDTIYYTIREGIATGLLPMGTRLREEELAEVFDVSRTPVREALKKLELERLIDCNSINGTVVRSLSVEECLDTLEVLELLRGAACELLLGRIPRSMLIVLEQNTRKGDHAETSFQQYENNLEFHDLLVRATGNSVLETLNTQLSFNERMINNTVLPVSFAPDYASHHRALLHAIVSSDKDALQQELEYNRGKVNDYMKKIVVTFLDVDQK